MTIRTVPLDDIAAPCTHGNGTNYCPTCDEPPTEKEHTMTTNEPTRNAIITNVMATLRSPTITDVQYDEAIALMTRHHITEADLNADNDTAGRADRAWELVTQELTKLGFHRNDHDWYTHGGTFPDARVVRDDNTFTVYSFTNGVHNWTAVFTDAPPALVVTAAQYAITN